MFLLTPLACSNKKNAVVKARLSPFIDVNIQFKNAPGCGQHHAPHHHGLPPLVELHVGEAVVGDELYPEDPLLVTVPQLQTLVGPTLADAVDLGRVAHLQDLRDSVQELCKRLIGEVVQSRRRPLLGPSPG